MSHPSSHPPGGPGIGRGIYIGTFFDIRFYLDYSWFLIAAILTWSLSQKYFPTVVPGLPAPVYLLCGVIAALLFFFCILLHELGHSLVSQRCGIPVARITLLFIGGVAEITREPDDAKSELKIALGGPVVSVALALGCLSLGIVFMFTKVAMGQAMFFWLAFINTVLVLFNAIPGYPLDGGRVLRAWIWLRTGDFRHATFITSRIGVGFSWILVACGLLMLFFASSFQGMVYIFIGFFLKSAAESGYQHAVTRDVLGDVPVGDVMTRQPVWIPSTTPVNFVVDDFFLAHHHVGFPVCDSSGIFLGLLRLEHLKELPRERWPYTTAHDVVIQSESEEYCIAPETMASEALRRILEPGCGRLAVVDGDRKLVGIITRHDLTGYMRVRTELNI